MANAVATTKTTGAAPCLVKEFFETTSSSSIKPTQALACGTAANPKKIFDLCVLWRAPAPRMVGRNLRGVACALNVGMLEGARPDHAIYFDPKSKKHRQIAIPEGRVHSVASLIQNQEWEILEHEQGFHWETPPRTGPAALREPGETQYEYVPLPELD
ncbi:uncharacterized protein CLAFUR5_09240 [Fulvia fulva]|uniref:Uncharacterized protein n=1 Tax=Passalora fulva TaxID=5499 RepID=A0A9Q8PG27_PASFU|nr:uncharacterized protein CLAFUR5_09240 [Fulvia fulva]UJO21752.1 hypothetical protein CLAFUR5_09240 [Fulvia fulva]